MTKPTFQEISDAERQWIENQIATGGDYVARYASHEGDLTLESLDSAWAAWMATAPSAVNEINDVINCIGIPFGAILVATREFEWCIATDDWGTDLAVRALPGQGDVLVYPTDFVSKRWQSRSTDFLVGAFPQIINQVAHLRQEWDAARNTQ